MITTKYRGTVARSFEKGFGFIRRDSDQANIFVHISEIDESYDNLTPGQRVEFEIAESKKKPGYPECVNVDVIL